MTDFPYGQIRSHRRNIKRYCRLLATELTDLERQYLHKRIADEHAELQRLEKSRAERRRTIRAEQRARESQPGRLAVGA
jgi:hypothetical protein